MKPKMPRFSKIYAFDTPATFFHKYVKGVKRLTASMKRELWNKARRAANRLREANIKKAMAQIAAGRFIKRP